MRRAVVLVIIAGILVGRSAGAPAPGGAFQSAWPYLLPPAGHFNTFVPNHLGLGLYQDLTEMPLALYLWQQAEFVPMMATSWTWNMGQRTFTVKLRRGERWSDGTTFTSADVAATFHIGYLLGYTIWRYIASIETPDTETVVFRFLTPASVAERLVLRTNIRSRAVYGTFADRAKPFAESKRPLDDPEAAALLDELRRFRPREIITTGPFRLDTGRITEAQVTLVKNPASWAGEHVRFDRIVLFNGETPQITPLVLAREIDYATHAFPPATDRQFQQQGFRVLRAPAYVGAALYFNHRISPLNRKEVRQAIAHAVNREQNGAVSLGPSGKGVRWLTGFSDNLLERWVTADVRSRLNPYDYNANRAAQILTGLGFKKGADGVWVSERGERLEYELSVPPEFADWSAAAEDIAGQLSAFGIKTVIRGVPNPQHLMNVNDGRFQLAIRLWGIGNPHPYFAYVQDLFNHNYPVWATTRGMDFNLQQETQTVGKVDMGPMVDSAGAGTNVGRQQSAITRLAQAFNELLPIIPLHERYSNSPVTEGVRVTGWPRDGDAIYKNHFTTDAFLTHLILKGTLRPAR